MCSLQASGYMDGEKGGIPTTSSILWVPKDGRRGSRSVQRGLREPEFRLRLLHGQQPGASLIVQDPL